MIGAELDQRAVRLGIPSILLASVALIIGANASGPYQGAIEAATGAIIVTVLAFGIYELLRKSS